MEVHNTIDQCVSGGLDMIMCEEKVLNQHHPSIVFGMQSLKPSICISVAGSLPKRISKVI